MLAWPRFYLKSAMLGSTSQATSLEEHCLQKLHYVSELETDLRYLKDNLEARRRQEEEQIKKMRGTVLDILKNAVLNAPFSERVLSPPRSPTTIPDLVIPPPVPPTESDVPPPLRREISAVHPPYVPDLLEGIRDVEEFRRATSAVEYSPTVSEDRLSWSAPPDQPDADGDWKDINPIINGDVGKEFLRDQEDSEIDVFEEPAGPERSSFDRSIVLANIGEIVKQFRGFIQGFGLYECRTSHFARAGLPANRDERVTLAHFFDATNRSYWRPVEGEDYPRISETAVNSAWGHFRRKWQKMRGDRQHALFEAYRFKSMGGVATLNKE